MGLTKQVGVTAAVTATVALHLLVIGALYKAVAPSVFQAVTDTSGLMARRLQLPNATSVFTDAVNGALNATTATATTSILNPYTTSAIPTQPMLGATNEGAPCIEASQCTALYMNGETYTCDLNVCKIESSSWWSFMNPDKNPTGTASTYGSSGSGSLLIALIFACIYKFKVIDVLEEEGFHPSMRMAPGKERLWEEIGICGCIKDTNTCLYVWCMPLIVASKNYDKTGVMEYWPACIVMHCSYGFPCLGACIRTYLSSQMKAKYNIQMNFCVDCLVNLWCVWCEIGRESMFVDDDMGVEIGCPFKVERSSGMRSASVDSGSEFGGPGPDAQFGGGPGPYGYNQRYG